MLRYMIIFSTLLITALNVRAQCEMPAVGENRIMVDIPNQETFPKGSTIKFKCSTGYIPVRSSASRSITCNGNQWSNLQLQCKSVSCEKPEIPHADRIEGKSPPYKYRQFVRYRCQRGYKMEGSDTLVCEEEGWNPPPPQCTVVTCSSPPDISNGHFSPQMKSYEYRNTVRYTCNVGFALKGFAKRTCTEFGTFEASPPKCLEIT